MAATHYESRKPLPRTESFQRMLDLEKRYKLARLQSAQTSPRSDSAMSFQPQIRPPPIQTRRRASRESLFQQHQHQNGDPMANGVKRPSPLPPLSISIPTPTEVKEREQHFSQQPKRSGNAMAADNDERPESLDDFDDATPREKTVTFLAHNDDEEDGSENEDAQSDQSSICQSPSWEGYGQKRKDKKKLAEQRKKEKERAEQELRAAAKKKSANRLFKMPPNANTPRERPSSSASVRLGSSGKMSTRSGSFTPSIHQNFIPEVWGMAMGGSRPRPPYSRAASALGSYTAQTSPKPLSPPSGQFHQGSSFGGKDPSNGVAVVPGREKDKKGDTTPTTNDKLSYPPSSSRSQTLRNVVPPSNSRRNSLSSVTAALPSKLEEVSKFFKAQSVKSNQDSVYSTGNSSEQTLGTPAEFTDRGRESSERQTTNSYVRKARAQSIERSIKGFMLEAALSDPGLTPQASTTSAPYQSLSQQPTQPTHQRPASSQSKHQKPPTPKIGIANNGNGAAAAVTNGAGPQKHEKQLQPQPQPQPRSLPQQQQQQGEQPKQDVLPQKSEKVEDKAEQQLQQQTQSNKSHKPAPSTASTRTDSTDKEGGDASTDYFNFVTKPYSPPSLDLITPSGGIFSSIKSRISRRSSFSSGSASGGTGRSFKERAMGAMHLPSGSAAAGGPHPPARKSSQNSSQTTVSGVSGLQGESAPQKLSMSLEEARRLPKPARVLGEFNSETMSQGAPARSRPSEGSSTSSYHDDSSIPPSPASTPDTSRPQSSKGLSATIEEIRIGSPKMFASSQEDLTVTQTLNKSQSTTKDAPSPDTSDSSTKKTKQNGTADKARNATDDRPRSKGRILDDIERPRSRGRLLENVSRPGSRGNVLEEVTQQAKKDGESTKSAAAAATERNGNGEILSSAAPNLSQGLGILDEAWSQSTVTPDADAQSFVTTLTNQHSKTSLKSLPEVVTNANIETVLIPERQSLVGADPSINGHRETGRPGSKQSLRTEDEMTEFTSLPNGVDQSSEKAQLRNAYRKKEKRSSSRTKHMSVVSEEPRQTEETQGQSPMQNQAAASQEHTDADPRKTSADVSFLPPLRHEAFVPVKSKARGAGAESDTSSPIPKDPSPPAMSALSSGRSSPSAMYLQEARRSAPMVSSPLSNVIRSAKANMSMPSLVAPPRPGLKTSTSFSQGYHPTTKGLLPPPSTSSSSTPSTGPTTSPTSPRFRVAAQEPEQLGKLVSKPMAKMLVECCHCKFFHDMPSRVYECMAQPDAVVTDRDLGVSGAITTMVKCPWCSHNMSTQCCAGYAAVVYLNERLH